MAKPKAPADPVAELHKKVNQIFTGFCPSCHKDAPIITKEQAKAKKSGITSKSAKQKGRRAQQAVAQALVEALGLTPEDIESVSMGVSGQDLRLSKTAREKWPFHAIEVTASPNVSLMAKFAQAERHAEKQRDGGRVGNARPILIFKKNGGPLFALCLFDDLLKAIAEQHPKKGKKAA